VGGSGYIKLKAPAQLDCNLAGKESEQMSYKALKNSKCGKKIDYVASIIPVTFSWW